jgi:hypothetical protein
MGSQPLEEVRIDVVHQPLQLGLVLGLDQRPHVRRQLSGMPRFCLKTATHSARLLGFMRCWRIVRRAARTQVRGRAMRDGMKLLVGVTTNTA